MGSGCALLWVAIALRRSSFLSPKTDICLFVGKIRTIFVALVVRDHRGYSTTRLFIAREKIISNHAGLVCFPDPRRMKSSRVQTLSAITPLHHVFGEHTGTKTVLYPNHVKVDVPFALVPVHFELLIIE